MTGRTSRLQFKKKRGTFLAVREAWNHRVSTGIMQMDKLWVGILILEKHLSIERELLLTHSLFLSLSSLLHHTTPPLFSAPFVFAPLVVVFFFCVCVFFCLCSHLIWSVNVLSCFSKHLLGVHYSLALLPDWDENKPGRSFCFIMTTVRLPDAVCTVVTWGSYFHSMSMQTQLHDMISSWNTMFISLNGLRLPPLSYFF